MFPLHFFKVHPISLLPMLVCWSGYAAIILYASYGYDWNGYSNSTNLLFSLCIYLAFSLLFGLASLILLEMVQQTESGKPISLIKSIADAIFRDLWKALPLLLIWGLIWFCLAVLSVLFSKKNNKSSGNKESFSAHNAVGTLLGDEKEFSSLSAFLDAVSKGVRMAAFLMLPAIAWEELSPLKAFRKGSEILKVAKWNFAEAYGKSGIFAFLVLLIPALIYKMDAELNLQLPETFWIFTLIYIAIASSLILIVEQIYMAELYLWYFNWQKENEKNKALGKPYIPFNKSRRPDFFDTTYIFSEHEI